MTWSRRSAQSLGASLYAVALRMISALLIAVSTLVNARLLPPGDFGLLYVYLVVIGLSAVIGSGGLGRQAIREMDDLDTADTRATLVDRILSRQTRYAAIAALLATLTVLLMSGGERWVAALISCVGAYTLARLQVHADLMRSLGRVTVPLLLIGRNAAPIQLGLGASAALLLYGLPIRVDFSVELVLAVIVASGALLQLLTRHLLSRSLRGSGPESALVDLPNHDIRASTSVRRSRTFLMIQIVTVAASQADIVVAALMLDRRLLGLYIAATRVVSLAAIPNLGMQQLVLPNIRRLVRLEGAQATSRHLSRSAALAMAISAPVILVCLVWPSTALELLLGADYTGAESALRVLTVAHVINVATGYCGSALMMLDQENRSLLALTVGAAITTVLGGVFSIPWQEVGLALGSTIGSSAAFIWMAVHSSRALGIPTWVWPLVRSHRVEPGSGRPLR